MSMITGASPEYDAEMTVRTALGSSGTNGPHRRTDSRNRTREIFFFRVMSYAS